MHGPILIQRSLTTFALLVLFASAALSQTSRPNPAEQNYEVTLNVFAGSNDASQRGGLPAAFGAISRQLTASFGYSNFRMINTYIGRIGSGGNIEYKSLADIFGREQQQQPDAPAFLEWRIAGLRPSEAAGSNSFQLNQFRFGARIPIRIGTGTDPSGKPQPAFNYESVGLNVDRLGVPENAPALIGTINLPRADGTVFLILTVRPVSNE
jgi:hypothetical protein